MRFFIIIQTLLALFLLLPIVSVITTENAHIIQYLFIVLPLALLELFLIPMTYYLIRGYIEDNKDLILFADLKKYNLPSFKINTITHELRIYPQDTLILPNKFNLISQNDSHIKLHYIDNIIFVNYEDSFSSTWYICDEFQEGHFIYILDEDFGHFYEKQIKLHTTNIETINNIKIEFFKENYIE